jgi:hypothetical protein
MIPENTFDTKTALSALYLWLLFGFLSTMVSCDLQRWMIHNPLFRHFIGIVAFFFLFTVINRTGTYSVGQIWTQTFIVYFIYILMTKSKWQFALPVLLLLIIDQTIVLHIKYIKAKNEEKEIDLWDSRRKYIDIAMIIFIVLGVIHYIIRQQIDFGKTFSWSKFLFVSRCST